MHHPSISVLKANHAHLLTLTCIANFVDVRSGRARLRLSDDVTQTRNLSDVACNSLLGENGTTVT